MLPVLSLVIVVALVVRAVAGDKSEVSRSLHLLVHPQPGFLALAVAAEVLSYVSYATAQRRLARSAHHPLSRGWLAALAIAAQALMDFLPAGYVAGNVLNFRELRQRKLPVAHCAWLLGMTSLLYMGVLLALACLGAIADDHLGWIPRIAGFGGLLVIAAAVTVATGRPSRHLRHLRRAALAILAWLERRRGIAARIAVSSRDVAGQIAEIRLPRGDVVFASAFFAASWLCDAACLTLAFAAIGVAPPWDALLVAYGAAQLVSMLPVSPGGFGLVEGSLTVMLTMGGRSVSEVLAAVLLYRAISYWGTLPTGAVGYLCLRHARRSRAGSGKLSARATIKQ